MSFKIFLNRYKIILIPILIFLVLIRLLLLQLPLFRNLDLEIAIVFAFLFSIIGAFLGLFFLKRNEKLIDIIVLKFILIVLIYFISLFIDLVVNRCPLTTGLLFYPIFVITSTSFGLFLAILISPIEGTKAYFILSIVILILIFYSLIEYYFEPQLFLYNPLIIFFPGFVYNEIFYLELRTLIYVIAVFVASAVVLISHLLIELDEFRSLRRIQTHLKIISLLILCLVFLFSEEIGLNTSQAKLKKYFPLKREGKIFEIYIEKPLSEFYYQQIYLLSTEYHYKFLKRLTGKSPGKIELFIFNNDISKKKLLGDEVADFTKPWLKQIFVTEKSFHQTVKHELAHIFLGESSSNLFKVAGNFNLGLIEGGAMALEWEWFENSPSYYSTLIDRYIGSFKVQDFFKNYSFVTRQSYLSYLMSGAFCKYLIDKYGIDKFMTFYRTSKFEVAYHKSIEDEFQLFLKSLRKAELKNEDSLMAIALFGGKSFFEKNCPRSLSRLNRIADKFFIDRKFKDAEKIYSNIWNKRKDFETFSNLIRVKFYQKQYDEVINLYRESEFKNKIEGISSIRSLILYALSLRMMNESGEAQVIFNQLKKLNLSSSWNAFINLMSILNENPEFINSFSEKSFVQFINDLLRKIPDHPEILKNIIDTLDTKRLDIVVNNSSNDFWILRKCFFRYLELGNFTKAKMVFELIGYNNPINNETKSYQLDLMKYIIQNISKGAYNSQ